ncbi:MAG: DUF6088 family protein [Planctomycetota bacterium]|nr:DUF6088 family protein [Planctomycetota bacterium]
MSMQSTIHKIVARIRRLGDGRVFTSSQFLDLGTRRAVDLALHRLAREGAVRRLARGLYDKPAKDPQLGVLMPPVEDIAKALKGRDAIRLQPSGAYAANLLSLSDQVPMRVVFLTDGSSRHVQVGKLHVMLKHTSPRNMATAGRISGLVIQALRHLGRDNIDDQVVKTLRRKLSAEDKGQLLKDLRFAPAWVADLMKQIAESQRRKA